MFIVMFCRVSKIDHDWVDEIKHFIGIYEIGYGGATLIAEIMISKNICFKN
jgi:hypothetical protein